MTGILLGLSFALGIAFGTAGLAIVALASLATFVFRKSMRVAAVVALGAALLGVWRSPEPPATMLEKAGPESVEVIGVVSSYPGSARLGQYFELVTLEDVNHRRISYCVETTNTRSVERGERIHLAGDVTSLNDLSSKSRASLRSVGCSASLESEYVDILGEPSALQQTLNTIRHRFESIFQQAAPGDTGALMTGLLTGDDSALSFESRLAFVSTGTTHITAVSGANFAVLITVVTMLSGGTGSRRRLRWIVGITGLIWFYALLVGLPPSAVRAALMASMGLLALRFGRRPDFLTLLVVCGAIQLFLRPDDLYSLSFQLSFVATLALVLVFSGWTLRGRNWAAAIVVSAIAAHLATVPVLVYRIGEIPFAAIPANIAVSPLVMVAFPMVALAGVSGLLSESLGIAMAEPGAIFSRLILESVERIGAVVLGATPVGHLPGAPVLVLTIFCWGLVLLMSHDARLIGGRMIASLGTRSRLGRTSRAYPAAFAIAFLIVYFGPR